MKQPIKESLRYYKPIESPTMYPLELTSSLHICLWDETGKYKCSIAYWTFDSEGGQLQFVGDRPFDERVDWRNFELIARQGQLLADKQYQDKIEAEE